MRPLPGVLGRAIPAVSIALLACAQAALSQESAPPATPSASEIIERHIAARGGVDKIRSIQTLRESGRIIAGPNRQALITREMKRPTNTRIELTLQGVTSIYVSNGERGWKMSPFDGDVGPSPLPEAAIAEAAEQADIEGPMVDWKAKGHQVELAGKETVNGREAWKVKLTLKSGAVRNEYIDAQTFIRLKSESTRTVRGVPIQLTTIFSDYQKTGGVLFPRTIELTAHGRPQQLRIVVESVEINPKLADDLFAMKDTTGAM